MFDTRTLLHNTAVHSPRAHSQRLLLASVPVQLRSAHAAVAARDELISSLHELLAQPTPQRQLQQQQLPPQALPFDTNDDDEYAVRPQPDGSDADSPQLIAPPALEDIPSLWALREAELAAEDAHREAVATALASASQTVHTSAASAAAEAVAQNGQVQELGMLGHDGEGAHALQQVQHMQQRLASGAAAASDGIGSSRTSAAASGRSAGSSTAAVAYVTTGDARPWSLRHPPQDRAATVAPSVPQASSDDRNKHDSHSVRPLKPPSARPDPRTSTTTHTAAFAPPAVATRAAARHSAAAAAAPAPPTRVSARMEQLLAARPRAVTAPAAGPAVARQSTHPPNQQNLTTPQMLPPGLATDQVLHSMQEAGYEPASAALWPASTTAAAATRAPLVSAAGARPEVRASARGSMPTYKSSTFTTEGGAVAQDWEAAAAMHRATSSSSGAAASSHPADASGAAAGASRASVAPRANLEAASRASLDALDAALRAEIAEAVADIAARCSSLSALEGTLGALEDVLAGRRTISLSGNEGLSSTRGPSSIGGRADGHGLPGAQPHARTGSTSGMEGGLGDDVEALLQPQGVELLRKYASSVAVALGEVSRLRDLLGVQAQERAEKTQAHGSTGAARGAAGAASAAAAEQKPYGVAPRRGYSATAQSRAGAAGINRTAEGSTSAVAAPGQQAVQEQWRVDLGLQLGMYEAQLQHAWGRISGLLEVLVARLGREADRVARAAAAQDATATAATPEHYEPVAAAVTSATAAVTGVTVSAKAAAAPDTTFAQQLASAQILSQQAQPQPLGQPDRLLQRPPSLHIHVHTSPPAPQLPAAAPQLPAMLASPVGAPAGAWSGEARAGGGCAGPGHYRAQRTGLTGLSRERHSNQVCPGTCGWGGPEHCCATPVLCDSTAAAATRCCHGCSNAAATSAEQHHVVAVDPCRNAPTVGSGPSCCAECIAAPAPCPSFSCLQRLRHRDHKCPLFRGRAPPGCRPAPAAPALPGCCYCTSAAGIAVTGRCITNTAAPQVVAGGQ